MLESVGTSVRGRCESSGARVASRAGAVPSVMSMRGSGLGSWGSGNRFGFHADSWKRCLAVAAAKPNAAAAATQEAQQQVQKPPLPTQFAVVVVGGKQYKVAANDVIVTERMIQMAMVDDKWQRTNKPVGCKLSRPSCFSAFVARFSAHMRGSCA